MAIEHIAPGRGDARRWTITDFMLNGHGLAHGGFIFALADSAFAFACNGYNQRAVGHQAAITYIAPAPARRPADRRRRARCTAAGPRRHLRRARDERPGRAGGRVPRPLAHREGNPPAGVSRRQTTNREEARHDDRAHPAREGLDAIETASRDEIAALQLERMKWSRAPRLRELALLPEAVRRRTACIPDDLADARRPREVPLHREAGPARHLSLRHVRRAARAARAHPRLLRHHRQADRGRLHARTTSTPGPT